MKILKNVILFIIIFSAGEIIFGQSIVTFDKNIFHINEEPFFPIGWFECNTINQLLELKKSEVNTVLVLWDFFVRANGNNFSPTGYKNALDSFLIAADSIGIKVIIQLPYKKQFTSAREFESAITHDNYINTLVPKFKDYPALLGWYLADEPEAVTNWKTQPYSRLQRWYKLIKELDENHPVFVCIANGYDLIDQTIGTEKNRNEENHFKMEPFTDVLMEDHYVIWENDSIPSPKLNEYDEWLTSLYESFILFNDHGLNAYSTMLVTQGYGGGISGHRNPDPVEIKYCVISDLEFAQNAKYKNSSLFNSGGLFFWRYGAANYECKNDINEFIKYFMKNHLDVVLRQKNINHLIISVDEQPALSTFLRYWKGSYYLFVINRSDEIINTDIKLNIGSYLYSKELLIPFGKTKTICLKDEEEGIFSYSEKLDGRDSKIIKIIKKQNRYPIYFQF